VNPKNFFAELKRRNVYKVAIAYGVVAWLLMQVASQIFPFFEIPNWAVRLVVLLLIIGFPVALILAWAFELTPEGIKRAEDVDLTKSTTRRTSHKLLWITAVVAIVAAALFVGGRFNLFRSKRAAATAVTSDKSIAVLPFDNLSRDPDNAYFAEGIQDEILARLSKIADLKVISRTSTQKYKSAPGNLREIAQQLGVSNILEGSVQKSAGQVRVTVQLINALTDTHLWAEIYDRKLTDIFAVESDVAKTIAETLRARLTGAEESAIAARPTENSEAHELYLRGRYFFGKRGADNLKRAIDYFNQAIAKDPNYAPAYAGIADSYAILSESPHESRADALNKARVAAEKGLALDNKLAEAHVSRGLLFVEDLNLKEAEREYQRAIELNPNYAFAHYLFGFDVLTPLGDFDHAISEMNRAVELDPFSGIINANLGWCYVCARRYPEAIAQFRKAAELDPNSPMPALALAHELSGQREQAITEYQRAYDLDHDLEQHSGRPADPMLLAAVYALKGEPAKELQQLEKGKVVAQRGELPAFFVALGYARLGDKNEAIEWLQRSYQNKEIVIADINVFPPLDPLRDDPRFQALAQKVIPRDAK